MGKRLFLTACLCTLFTLGKSINTSERTSLFINQFKDMAIAEMHTSGIPASIILAQCIHESSWGNSPLAVNANNYFGIKCKTEWEGENYFHKDDDKDINGDIIESCFRVYDSVDESFADHSDFLLTRDRYQNLFSLDIFDYKGWAKGLQKSGYATDKKYAKKLIKTIEEYQLFELDRNLLTYDTVYISEVYEKTPKEKEKKIEEYTTILGIRIKNLYDLEWAK